MAGTGSGALRWSVGIAGFCAFVNLYAPQALLPMLSQEFGAGPAEISHIMTASTLAVAITAPFSGAVADMLGRKRVIVAAMLILAIPTLMLALAPSLNAMIFWRFVQGLVLPPIFAVTVAYIGDELPPREAATATGIYTSGSSFGGFAGRFIAGLVADLISWRYAYGALAVIPLVGALAVTAWLPRETRFVRSSGMGASGRQMLAHLRNPQIIATCAVGFGVLFNFVATFTYVSFHLAAPPFSLSATALGGIFVVYLVGSVLTPWAGAAIARFGRRRFMLATVVVWAGGIALTLAPSIGVIALGLAVCAGCGMLCQTISTGTVTITAQAGRSSAVGLYVMVYYVGGSCGAAVGGIVYTFGAWPACVAMVALMLVLMALIVAIAWPTSQRPPPAAGPSVPA